MKKSCLPQVQKYSLRKLINALPIFTYTYIPYTFTYKYRYLMPMSYVNTVKTKAEL